MTGAGQPEYPLNQFKPGQHKRSEKYNLNREIAENSSENVK